MKKYKIILPLILIALIIGGIGYYYYNQQKSSKRTNSDSISQELIEQADEEPATTEADQRGDNENTTPGSASADGDLSRPSISTLEQSGDELIVRTVINNAKSGECKLTLKKGSKLVEKTAKVGLVTSYYTCQGFDVPVSELSAGKWSVSVTLSSGDESVVSGTKTVEIN